MTPTSSASNLSYFIGLDADTNNPNTFLSGDSNLQLAGTLLKPGLTTLVTSNDVILGLWSSDRKATFLEQWWQGNIGLADGSAARYLRWRFAMEISGNHPRHQPHRHPMKLNHPHRTNRALNLFEVMLVITIVLVMAVLLLPAILTSRPEKHRAPACVNNLKMLGMAYWVWAGDNNDKFPMDVPVSTNGAMELITTGNVLSVYLCMSNELSTARILHCPEDGQTTAVALFNGLNRTNVSYFVGPDANEDQPQMILSGDDNLAISNVPVTSGILTLPPNTPIAWTKERHVYAGNIGLADGSVQQVTNSALQNAFQQTGYPTNRIAIP